MQTPSEPQSAFRETHLRDYWKIVSQGRWTILAVFVAVVGLTVAWTYLQTPIYKATAIIEVQPKARRVLASSDVSGMGAAGYGWFAEEKYHNTQIEIIKSRDVAERVAKTLDLGSHGRFETLIDPVGAFRNLIRVSPRRDTGLLEVSIQGTDRDEITEWVNVVADTYVDRNLERAEANVQLAVDAVRKQMTSLGRDLTEAEGNRIEVMETTELFDQENQEELLRQQHSKYFAELTDVRIELSQLSETIRQVREMQAAGGDLLMLPELADDLALQELGSNRVELGRKLQSEKVDLRPWHPEYERTLGELQSVEDKIAERTRLIVGGMEAAYQGLHTSEAYLVEQIGHTEDTSLVLAKKGSAYEIAKTQADMKKQIFDLIARTVNEVSLSAGLISNNVGVLDQATPPLFPIKPRKKVNVIIGAFFGLFCGLGAVFFLDYLDNTIRTPEDVERYLGVTVLGVIPKIQNASISQRVVKEAYQSLRTSVIFSSKNRTRKVILVTSTGPREGKSSTISNLGRTLAAAGDRVCIIDCDLRRPRQHVHFKLEREPGLTNFLAAPESETDWTVYPRTVEPRTLQLLSCGPIPPSPPELLSNKRFSALLIAMREHYDWILIDSPPAASLSDATLLAVHADMIIPVIQHNSTDRDHVVKTLATIRAVNPEIPGVVLNNVDMDRAYHKDYYYAGYYYEEDAAQVSRKRRADRNVQVG